METLRHRKTTLKLSLGLALLGVLLLLSRFAFTQSDYETGTTGATRTYGKSTEVGDPLSAGNGAYSFTMPLLSLGGPMDLRFELFYRSDALQLQLSSPSPNMPDNFWWQPFTRAETGVGTGAGLVVAWVLLPNGDQIGFQKDASGNYVLTDPTVTLFGTTFVDNRPQIKYQLKETTGYIYFLDPINELLYIFEKYQINTDGSAFGRPVRIMDRSGNQLIYTHESATVNRPTRIEDGLGRSFDLTYTTVRGLTFLQKVTDQGGRQVTFTYEASGADNCNARTLRSVTDPLNQTTTFQYAGCQFLPNQIASQTLPLGNKPFTQTYANQTLNGSTMTRVVSQQDALGNTTTLSYDSAANIVTETRPDTTTRKYEHFSSHGLPKALTDPTNKAATMAKNDDEQITSVTDRRGDTTSFTYQADTGKLASITNAKGDTLTHTYTAQNQTFTNPINGETADFTFYDLTRTDYPDGANEQFTYDAQGNVLSRVDRNGRTWSYTYNGRGQVLTATNPTGGVTTFTYNDDATLDPHGLGHRGHHLWL